ncbi:hypothetical protein [Gallaecimonas sp. GXIMD4217]|uniref:hypothetical protein n=1 Tax=Gallaecimonas sp. GXIMD4217 TaxID=3131927 RepID=UPI00311AD267
MRSCSFKLFHRSRPILATALLLLALPGAASSVFVGDLYLPTLYTGARHQARDCTRDAPACHDKDNDGVPTALDQCPFTPADVPVDPASGCSQAQLCPCEGPRDSNLLWPDDASYRACLSRTAGMFTQSDRLAGRTLADPMPAHVAKVSELSCNLAKNH